MKTLTAGLIISGVAVFFVNVLLFGFFKISLEKISLGSLLGLEAVFALFFLFMFLITQRKV